MDNLCHTLAGLALGEAGLKHRSRLGTATLAIAANLPDIDVLVFATDVPSVAFRRGWTHGVLAQALLPPLLAAAMMWIGKRRQDGLRHIDLRGLVLLSYIGVLSHVGLDVLNNYGVRLLMPFSGRWFYGDSVFIVDVWLWLMLGIGVWLARRWKDMRVARFALVMACAYIAVLVISARVARAYVIDEWRAAHGGPPQAVMVGPMPITPFSRVVIVDAGAEYQTGSFRWLPRRVILDAQSVPKNDDHPAVRAAIAQDRRFPAVLLWARFPYYSIESVNGRDVVTLRDLRFGERVGGVRAVVAASEGFSRPADPSR